jgi:predicted ATPase/DNA-binding XRE family transcriptional regulator
VRVVDVSGVPESDAVHPGELLRDLRRAAGLTQEQLAERAGISPRSISELERGGEHVPRRDTVDLLARALGLAGSSRDAFESSVEQQRRSLLEQRRPVHSESTSFTASAVADRLEREALRPLTSLIGREQELADLSAALAAQPLLTLVGPGGVGKTRLAQELVRRHHSNYPEGCWFVELAGLSDPLLVPGAIAQAIGLREARGDMVRGALVDYIGLKRVLLVLDNCEHLIEACADLVGELLGKCRNLQVMTTSREPLAITGEMLWQVLPLEVPVHTDATSLERLSANPAVRLFVDRAQAASQVSLTPDNALDIARICVAVDGIPLAIELAAARTRMFAIEQLANMLEAGVGVLAAPGRFGAASRHRALRATIDWSYDLLTPEQRILLRRFSVFAGGWTLEAAEDVCAGSPIDSSTILDLLGDLVEKSMVLVDTCGTQARYRLLEPIRQYALEHLESSGEADAYRRRHAMFFLDVPATGTTAPSGPDEIASLERFDDEHANMRLALRWALSHGEVEAALRSAASLFRFWERRGHFQEGCAWLEQGLSRNDGVGLSPGVRATALNALAFLYWRGGAGDRAQPLAEQALAVSQSVGMTRGIAEAYLNLGMSAFLLHDYPRAESCLENSVTFARQADRTPMLSVALAFFARVLLWVNGPHDERATGLLQESLALAQSAQSRYASGHALATSGDLLWGQSHLARAVAYWRSALAVFSDVADRRGIAGCLERLALALARSDHAEPAAWLFGAADAQHLRMGMPLRSDDDQVDHAHFVRDADRQPAQSAFPEAWAAGQQSSLKDSVAKALEATHVLKWP